jgi:hypothetical protein
MMQVPGTRKYCDACQETAKIRYCPICMVEPIGKSQRTCEECRKPRGGNHGGGTTVKAVVLSDKAAQYIKRRATIAGPRYTKLDANRTASAILEAGANDRLLLITDDMIAARDWLADAKRLCFAEQAQRGLEQMIAALEVARRT